jgi:hypothetical protein
MPRFSVAHPALKRGFCFSVETREKKDYLTEPMRTMQQELDACVLTDARNCAPNPQGDEIFI